MPTKRSRLNKFVLVPLFVFIVSEFVEESDQHISRSSPAESLCLRRCHLRQVTRSNTKVSIFSCYDRCINRITKDRQAFTADIFKQRVRKALKPIPECGVSSPNQTVDWHPSKVNVTFGQYENTSHWYVNVSWTPLNDSYGNWTAILVRLVVPSFKTDPAAPIPTICSVHPKNRTFLNINISSYQYLYPNPIFLKVLGLPYSSKEDYASIRSYTPHMSTSLPNKIQTTAIQSTTPRTTGAFSTTARKSNCSLKEYGDLDWQPSNVDGHFLKRSNGHWFANISWTPLTNSSVTWAGYFLVFYFGNIREVTGFGTTKCFKVAKNLTSYIVDSSHGWKPPQSISVKVTAYPFRRKSESNMKLIIFPTTKTTSTIQVQAASASPSTEKSRVIGTVFASVGGFFVLLLAVLLVVFQNRRKKISSAIPVATPTRFKYHAFIIYSMADSSDFVDNTLVPTLERYCFKCCVHWKDFPPGEVFTKSIVNSVYNSFKVIAVVSKNFFTSTNCQYEMDQAVHRLMINGDNCLIVIKYDDVNVAGLLHRTLLKRSYIDYTKVTDQSTWESKVVNVLKTAVVEDESDDHSEETTTHNNNLPPGNLTENELMCSCQAV